MNKELIKEFRETIVRKPLRVGDAVELDEIERFWLSKLKAQNQEEYKRGYNQRLKDEGKVGERWTHLYL